MGGRPRNLPGGMRGHSLPSIFQVRKVGQAGFLFRGELLHPVQYAASSSPSCRLFAERANGRLRTGVVC
jgi:hypothetical protein